ncbi:acetyl-CoA carboxylase biotin carboxyl carrier protein [Lacticaseibacillus absianus]|uniref:acetyl-CoA carboxylase biotin carboxyl carrier protein n=1 Tax=Lacticaseibacillus absianus TaxID=2729623 RepID=UPI0015CE688D|nr:biotin/lipoyl-containing protein [Lacticaseibacillus absianus]
MDAELIKALMTQLEASSLCELELSQGDDHLRLKKAGPTAPPAAVTPAAPTPAQAVDAEATITAPLVGIVYLSAEPGAPVFKQVGDHVAVGEVVCIIESMKMMNEIHSHVSGTIKAVNVDNESLVEYHQPLFTVEEEPNA